MWYKPGVEPGFLVMLVDWSCSHLEIVIVSPYLRARSWLCCTDHQTADASIRNPPISLPHPVNENTQIYFLYTNLLIQTHKDNLN